MKAKMRKHQGKIINIPYQHDKSNNTCKSHGYNIALAKLNVKALGNPENLLKVNLRIGELFQPRTDLYLNPIELPSDLKKDIAIISLVNVTKTIITLQGDFSKLEKFALKVNDVHNEIELLPDTHYDIKLTVSTIFACDHIKVGSLRFRELVKFKVSGIKRVRQVELCVIGSLTVKQKLKRISDGTKRVLKPVRKPIKNLVSMEFKPQAVESTSTREEDKENRVQNKTVKNLKIHHEIKKELFFTSSPLKRKKQRLYDEEWEMKRAKAYRLLLNDFLIGSSIETSFLPSNDILKNFDNNSLQKLLLNRKVQRKSFLNQAYMKMETYFYSPNFSAIRARLERAIAGRKITIRTDKKVFQDIGLQKQVISLLLRYNITWLSFALGIVLNLSYSIVKEISSATKLREYLKHYVLEDKDMHLRKSKHLLDKVDEEIQDKAIQKFLLRFFLIVFLIDRTASSVYDQNLSKLMPSCVFAIGKTKPAIKSSVDIVTEFNKGFVSSEGNILKTLSCVLQGKKNANEPVLQYKQSLLDEYNFKVIDMKNDLKNGIVFAKFVHKLLKQKTKLTLRVPAESRLQKIHNVKLAINLLKKNSPLFFVNPPTAQECTFLLESAISIKKSVALSFIKRSQREFKKERQVLFSNKNLTSLDAKDIVSGNLSKTLSFLWDLISSFCLSTLISKSAIYDLIRIKYSNIGIELKEESNFDELVHEQLILELLQLCAASENLYCYNLTSCMSDGKVILAFFKSMIPEVSQIDRIDNTSNLEKVEICLDLFGINISMLGLDTKRYNPEKTQMVIGLCYVLNYMVYASKSEKAIVRIQKAWRQIKVNFSEVKPKTPFFNFKKNIVAFQSLYRGYLSRQNFASNPLLALHLLQKRIKKFLKDKSMHERMQSATQIQSFYRGTRKCQIYQYIKTKVIFIQRFYRDLINKRFQQRIKLNQASVQIQKFMRCLRLKHQFKLKKKFAIIVQKYWRCFIEGKRYNLIKQGVISMQAQFRKSACKQLFLRVRANIIYIQSQLRGFLSRKCLMQQRISATIIQTFFRKISALNKFKYQKRLVIKCQGTFRSFLARKKFKSDVKKIVSIQAFSRRTLIRSKYVLKRSLAIKFQSIVRMKFAKAKLKHKLLQLHQLVSIVKMWLQRKSFLLQKNKVGIIQRYYRGLKLRKHYLSMKISAVLIQSSIRAFIGHNFFSKLKISTKLLQHYYRGIKSQQRYNRFKKNVILCQAQIRRTQCLTRYQLIKKGTIRFQTLVKRHFQRKWFLAIKKKTLIIQKNYRCVITRRFYLLQTKVATYIQSLVRAKICRRAFCNAKKNITRLQCFYRVYRCRNRFRVMIENTILIQKTFRKCVVRSTYLSYKLSITKLQSIVRMKICLLNYYSARKHVVRLQNLRRQAICERYFQKQRLTVIKIQSVFRSFKARNMFLIKKKTVIYLQKVLRMVALRKNFVNLRQKVGLIQSNFRRSLCQLQYKKLRGNTILIQSFLRCTNKRKQFLKYSRSIVVLQSLVRMRLSKLSFEKQKTHATSIQNFARSICAQKRYLKLKTNCIKIQTFFRGAYTRKNYITKRSSCIYIQSKFRSFSKYLKYRFIRNSTVTIQKYVRMFLARKGYETQRSCSIVLQGFIRMTIHRTSYIRKQGKIILIQTRLRCFRQRVKYLQKKTFVSKFVSVVRAYLQRRVYLAYRSSAILLQSAFRCHILKLLYAKVKKSIIRVQTNFRRQFCLSRFSKLKSSTIKMQALYRGSFIKFVYGDIKQKITIVQSVIRKHLCRKRFTLIRLAAISIQSFIRMLKYRKNYQTLLKATKRLIAWWLSVRNNLKEKLAKKRLERAVITLQSHERGNLVRNSSEIIKFRKKLEHLRLKRKYETTNKALIRIPLNERMSRAINWIKTSSKFSLVLLAVSELEICTRHSRENSKRLLFENDSKHILIVFDVLLTVNRSEPHIRGLQKALKVLKNILYYFDCMFFVLKDKLCMEDVTSKLIEKIQFATENKTFSLALCLLQKQVEFDSNNKIVSKSEIHQRRLLLILKKRKTFIENAEYSRLSKMVSKLDLII